MKRLFRKVISFCLLCSMTAASCIFWTEDAKALSRPSYLKSVTYFSDEWAINFWSTESPNMEAELRQIADDGFNSIILIIPWREFQPDIYQYHEYNPYAMEKLNRIMEAAERTGLWVTARIGYTWDYYDSQNVLLRYENLLDDRRTQSAWKDYAATMYGTLSAHPNFYGAYLTWEDFWGFMEGVFSKNEGYDARKKAESSGYTPYLRKNYSLDEISALYEAEISRYSDLAFPKRETPAARLVYEWYDEYLNDLLKTTQSVFPGISMEVRLDQDPVYDEDGNLYLYSHDKTYPCGSASFIAAMISVSMGQVNKGESISASKAVATLNSVLGSAAAKCGGKPMYFEQFLYMDNTEQFQNNAQVADGELPSFIVSMAPVLKRYGMGYGLWVYRDYAENLLYNPQFALGMRGWTGKKGAAVKEQDGTNMAMLPAGGTLKQRLHGNVYGDSQGLGEFQVAFRAVTEKPETLTVTLGDASRTLKVEGDKNYQVSFYGASGGSLSFESGGTVYLDDIKAYRHVQQARCRDMYGNELDCLPAIRSLNRTLGK